MTHNIDSPIKHKAFADALYELGQMPDAPEGKFYTIKTRKSGRFSVTLKSKEAEKTKNSVKNFFAFSAFTGYDAESKEKIRIEKLINKVKPDVLASDSYYSEGLRKLAASYRRLNITTYDNDDRVNTLTSRSSDDSWGTSSSSVDSLSSTIVTSPKKPPLPTYSP